MLKIIQVETDEHKPHIQEVFWEYFHETKLKFSEQFGINLDVIATASMVRTLSAGHTPSHHVDNQTGQVACESDF